MNRSADIAQFEERLGYRFQALDHLQEALTHPSRGSLTRNDNQRLEFLGDRVLGLVMAQALLERDPTASEGLLAPRYNALVRKETCASVARDIDIGGVLKLGRSEMMSGGRRKDALLADALEAVIAAIYLDGGFEAAQKVVTSLWGDRVSSVKADARDAKTTLQEWAQSRGFTPPKYTVLKRTGPDHAPVFTIEVTLDDGQKHTAVAGSKRNAEQAAANALLEKLKVS